MIDDGDKTNDNLLAHQKELLAPGEWAIWILQGWFKQN